MDERCTHSEGVIKNCCGNSLSIHFTLSCECGRQTVPLPASPTGLLTRDLHVRRAANVWRGNSNKERVSPIKRTASASWSPLTSCTHACEATAHCSCTCMQQSVRIGGDVLVSDVRRDYDHQGHEAWIASSLTISAICPRIQAAAMLLQTLTSSPE